MRPLLPALAAAAVIAAAPAVVRADVVVELFSSQGCSACPPADAILHELTRMDGVIPLALHVDYWDYIGWTDLFASPAFTARQERYALVAGERTVYTPQFIVGGTHAVVGAKAMEIMGLIGQHAAVPDTVALTVAVEGGMVRIRAERLQGAEPLVVQLVRYVPEQTVDILQGENAGHRLVYANVVSDWQVLGRWDGAEPLDLSAPLDGDAPAVVILQAEGPGPIRAAARVSQD